MEAGKSICSPPVRSAIDVLLLKGSALLTATVAASRPFHAAIQERKGRKIRLDQITVQMARKRNMGT